jgi:hypothetical protein
MVAFESAVPESRWYLHEFLPARTPSNAVTSFDTCRINPEPPGPLTKFAFIAEECRVGLLDWCAALTLSQRLRLKCLYLHCFHGFLSGWP